MNDNNIELSTEFLIEESEQEVILENEIFQKESERGTEEELVQQNNQEYSCDMSELVATMEVLQSDVEQLVSFVDSVRVSLTCVVFILLFIWAERKIKGAVIKMTGGKKNANID